MGNEETPADTPAGPGDGTWRIDGFAPIEGYAPIGDGRSVALVARDGAIDWLPIPRLDAPPVLAAILDPERGGCFRLAPAVPATTCRRYVPGTNVLETVYTCDQGVVRVRDALNLGMMGPPPWTELVRSVEAESGAVPMAWEFVPGGRFDHPAPELGWSQDTPVIHVGDQHLALIVERAGRPEVTETAVRGRFIADSDNPALLAVTAADDEPLHLPAPDHVRGRLAHTIDAWRYMTERVQYDGPHGDAVVRAVLTLRLLFFRPTGGFAAAATTSLPEAIGGSANFDYRYVWVRDSSFTMDALVRLRLWEETHAALTFLLGAVERQGGMGVFYGLDGDKADETATIDMRGYRDSRPVRSGNDAGGQLQLGNYGDLLDATWQATRGGTLLDPWVADLITRLADTVCEKWREPDCGIWELPEHRHYTISKIGCWVALDRALRLAEAGMLPHAPDHWSAEREALRAWIDKYCWSAKKQAYTQHTDTEDLDAAVLLSARTGFLSGDDPRLASTVDAIRAELACGDGSLIYRFSASRGQEGAFVACSYWLVIALHTLGRHDEAERLFRDVTAHANDVGVFSEQIDPHTGAALGNTPQALSHLALINAATASGPAGDRG